MHCVVERLGESLQESVPGCWDFGVHQVRSPTFPRLHPSELLFVHPFPCVPKVSVRVLWAQEVIATLGISQ